MGSIESLQEVSSASEWQRFGAETSFTFYFKEHHSWNQLLKNNAFGNVVFIGMSMYYGKRAGGYRFCTLVLAWL